MSTTPNTFQKHNFRSGQILTASALNEIENELVRVGSNIGNSSSSSDAPSGVTVYNLICIENSVDVSISDADFASLKQNVLDGKVVAVNLAGFAYSECDEFLYLHDYYYQEAYDNFYALFRNDSFVFYLYAGSSGSREEKIFFNSGFPVFVYSDEDSEEPYAIDCNVPLELLFYSVGSYYCKNIYTYDDDENLLTFTFSKLVESDSDESLVFTNDKVDFDIVLCYKPVVNALGGPPVSEAESEYTMKKVLKCIPITVSENSYVLDPNVTKEDVMRFISMVENGERVNLKISRTGMTEIVPIKTVNNYPEYNIYSLIGISTDTILAEAEGVFTAKESIEQICVGIGEDGETVACGKFRFIKDIDIVSMPVQST